MPIISMIPKHSINQHRVTCLLKHRECDKTMIELRIELMSTVITS